MEILFVQIRSNEIIHGLKFFGYEFKLTAFADDVSYFLKDIDSVKELLKLLEQLSQFTSLLVADYQDGGIKNVSVAAKHKAL